MRHDGKFSSYLALVERLRAAKTLRIDHDLCGGVGLEHVLRFAREEEKHGIRATYLPLHLEPYWHHPRFDDFVEHLRQMGHFIGVHHDSIAPWLSRLTAPWVTLAGATERLRRRGPVTVCAAHGSPDCYTHDGKLRYVAYEAFAEFDPAKNAGAAMGWKFPRVALADLGLAERYFSDHTIYVSDSGGAWHGWSPRPEVMPFERYPEIDRGLGVLDDVTAQSRVMLLAHPVWTMDLS